MQQNCNMMLKELMAVSFSAFDLHLYLNTHPCDARAIQLYNQCVQKSRVLKDRYQKLYGPLTTNGFYNDGGSWKWIEGPWPWE